MDPPRKGNDLDGNFTPDIHVSPYFLMLFGLMASTISDAISEALKESQISSSTKFGEILDRIVKQKIALDHLVASIRGHRFNLSLFYLYRGTVIFCC